MLEIKEMKKMIALIRVN